jgi:ribose-phosphate pyrophosphokinase
MQCIALSAAKSFGTNAFVPNTSPFADGEISVDFLGLDFSTSSSFLVVQSLFGSSNALLELLFTIDVLRRNSSSNIHLLLPYLSYARQDREISRYSPISAKVIADILSNQNIQTVSVVEIHSPQVQGFFNKPCFNISMQDIFLKHICESFSLQEIVICAADIGGAKSARKISEYLSVQSAIVEKTRSAPGVSQALSVIGDVSGKNCIIVDDIIDSAGTLCNAANILKQNGAKDIFAYATHGIFSGSALEKIENSELSKVFVSNTIPQKYSSKVQYIDVSENILNQVKARVLAF